MSNITTRYFSKKISSAVQGEFSNNIYYFTVSKFSPWTDENNPDTAIETTQAINQFHREMILGKRIKSEDVISLIPRHFWTSNTVYTQYDDTDPDLFDKEFYVVNGSEQVYKCLFNNGGIPSTSEPTLVQTSKFQTADGYVWKYMYSISTSNNSKFSTGSYIPIDANSSVVAAAANGSIDIVLITDQGSGYSGYITGTIGQVISNSLFRVESSDQLAVDNFLYNTSGFYITDGTGEGQLTTISNYVVNGSGHFVFTTDPINSPALDLTSGFRIAPQIRITGDGTGAKAVCTVNTTSSNFIETIDVINVGSGYTYANVDIISNPSYGTGATARAVIPPFGGHGADPATELGSKLLGISTFFNNNESSTVSTEVTFRQGGIISAPLKFTLPTGNLTFNALSGVSNTNDTISIADANTYFKYGDKIQYVVDAGNTAIGGLANGDHYYVIHSNTTTVKLALTLDGSAINLTSGSSETGHRLYTQNNYSSNTFNALTTLSITSGSSQLANNEYITGLSSNAYARVAFANSTVAKVSMIRGSFTANSTSGETIVGSSTSATVTINANGINNPDIKTFSSQVLHIDNIEYIQRSDADNEQGYLIITL